MKSLAITVSALALLAACGNPTASEAPLETSSVPEKTAPTEAVATESTRLNEWFEAKFKEDLARSPMSQTYLGVKDDYDKWDNQTDAFAAESLEIARANVAKMRETFDINALDDQAKLSWRLAEYELEQAEAAYPFRHHNYPFNQMFGAQSGIPAFLINQHKITSVKDAEDYVARLEGVLPYMRQHIANAQAASDAGIRPPLFVYDYVLNDARNMLAAKYENVPERHPLEKDFFDKIDKLRADNPDLDVDTTMLTKNAVGAIKGPVRKAYEELIAFLEADMAKADENDGIWKLPDADAYYAQRLKQITTTEMTADEIHDLGLAEVARIQDEMRVIKDAVGFEGDLKAFMDFMRSDPQFYKPNTAEGRAEYLIEATAMIDEMREDLPSVFNTFPKAEMIVKAVEPFREQSAGKAFYSRPAPDGSRPGTYYANLYRMEDMPTYQMEALAFHEGIPGHHMQIAIAQELQGVPKFRKYGGYTAFSEGWGLYSEYLPKEMGYYKDPYSDFGRLAMEIWRAARLVVDTGLHDKKWTRQEATDYLLENTPNPEGDAIKAIDRYIVMPGQATAYKIGMIKILELRENAKAELGDAFSLAEFHDIILRDGPVPLAVMEENVERWVAAKQGE